MPGGRKEDYEVIEDIGSGSFGICQKVKKKSDGKIMAWKVIEYGGMSAIEKQQLVKEVNLLRELRHKHIVRYQDRIIDKANSQLYIVMEYCSGGDMAEMIAKMKKERTHKDELFIWRVMYQLSLALEECHTKRDHPEGGKVLHRDIKPANVFIGCNGDVKLGDFGLARILHDTSLAKTFVGTPYYMSPEQYQYTSYDHMSDMWSLGCLLYELCALSPPFTAPSQRELRVRVCSGYFTRIPSKYSDELQSTIASLLHTNPMKRPAVSSVVSTAQAHIQKLSIETKVTVSSDQRQYGLLLEQLKIREQTLIEKEKSLLLKEKELKHRERVVERKEQQMRLRDRQLLYVSPNEADVDRHKIINQARVKLSSKKKENNC